MERLLLWTLLNAAVWEPVPGQVLLSDPVPPQFPVLGLDHAVDCECGPRQCEQVVWFRTLVPSGTLEVLGQSNQADRVTYGPGLDQTVRIFKRSGSGYTLRILNTTTADRGVYSCVLKLRGKESEDVWRNGVLLLPQKLVPTKAPEKMPKGPPSSRCPCENLSPPSEGCGHLVLWPLVGLSSALMLTLVCTLFYYSRLPKKCRHQFMRKK